MSVKNGWVGDPAVTASWIPAMVATLVERFQPLRIVLVGSLARGAAGRDSDVDLLVVLPAVDDKRQAAIEMRRALARIPVPKDIVVTTPDEIARRGTLIGSILRPALREGRLLYERR